ncbi:MAG TPA: RNA methyltransferase [Bacteroidales bacterium]|nr:RNA methyltransferase [Bacteroidales bacterium]HRZ76134.1 RNA methyltransferase [Bacteroidales bacterium]
MRKLEMHELGRPDPESYRLLPKLPVVLVLDNIRSQQNVGSLFRTADAFLMERLLLCGITATPPHREIHRAALGATDSVAWEYHATAEEAVLQLKQDGYLIAGVEQVEGSTPLESFEPPAGKPLAVILGNEVNGMSDNLLPLCDIFLEIRQYGTKHSLNVSVCGGIVMWEVFRKMYRAIR